MGKKDKLKYILFSSSYSAHLGARNKDSNIAIFDPFNPLSKIISAYLDLYLFLDSIPKGESSLDNKSDEELVIDFYEWLIEEMPKDGKAIERLLFDLHENGL